MSHPNAPFKATELYDLAGIKAVVTGGTRATTRWLGVGR
jgi:hypothetical protein